MVGKSLVAGSTADTDDLREILNISSRNKNTQSARQPALSRMISILTRMISTAVHTIIPYLQYRTSVQYKYNNSACLAPLPGAYCSIALAVRRCGVDVAGGH